MPNTPKLLPQQIVNMQQQLHQQRPNQQQNTQQLRRTSDLFGEYIHST